jgi:hypothetical protein
MAREASAQTKKSIPLPSWTGLAIFGVAVVLAFALTMKFGLAAALIMLAGGALILFIWLSFRAVQSVTEPDDESVLVDIAPTPAQGRKASALRALKDLEFEKSLGNLNEADYRELEARYREEAKLAMREVDEERSALRERAEKIAKKAIDRELDDEGAASESERVVKPTESNTTECPKCETTNDPDAAFCKRCGEKLSAA